MQAHIEINYEIAVLSMTFYAAISDNDEALLSQLC